MVDARRTGPGGGAGGEALTDRELEVADLVAVGASNREVARRLGLSVRTVEVHLSRIYRKVGVRSRVELALAMRPPDGQGPDSPGEGRRGSGTTTPEGPGEGRRA